jgi:hypothetical protein
MKRRCMSDAADSYVEIYAEEKEAGDDPLDEIERELAEDEVGRVEPEEEEIEGEDDD